MKRKRLHEVHFAVRGGMIDWHIREIIGRLRGSLNKGRSKLEALEIGK